MHIFRVKGTTLFQQNGQMHIDYYVQKLDLCYIGYFNIQGLDVNYTQFGNYAETYHPAKPGYFFRTV